MPDEIDGLREEQLEEIIDRKVKEQVKEIKKDENKSPKENESVSQDSSQNISRREFLKKAGLGAAGLATLVGPALALNIKSNSLSFADNESEYLDIASGGPVKIQNADLEIGQNLGIGVSNPSLPLEISSSKGIQIPMGDNSQRSDSPKEGEFRINSEKKTIEIYESSSWRSVGKLFYPVDATGGDEVFEFYDSKEDVNYRVHAFTATGSSTFEVLDKGSHSNVEALIVGAGGGGGGTGGSGGGAGGLIFETITVQEGTREVYVGTGGRGGETHDNDKRGLAGEDSYFGSLTAVGGGGGSGHKDCSPNPDGGSGGGARPEYCTTPGSGTNGQGYEGGSTSNTNGYPAAGGGGAGEPGESTSGDNPGEGDGGNGLYYGDKFSENFGENGWFSGGGGGGHYEDKFSDNEAAIGKGGKGGGGDGGFLDRIDDSGNTVENGTPNTGGGGGGGGYTTSMSAYQSGGNGGSGIVLIRYPLERP